MKKLFFILIFFSFYILSFTNVFGQDGWLIEINDDTQEIWITQNGEITHGDKYSLVLFKEDCDVVQDVFTFYTMLNNKDIGSLKERVLGTHINGEIGGAKVLFVLPFLSGHSVWFSYGHTYVDDYISYWSNAEWIEVEILIDEDFKADEYFDVLKNKWSMVNFTESLKNGQKECKNL